MQAINKNLYMGTIFGSLGAGLVLNLFSLALIASHDRSVVALRVFISLLVLGLTIFGIVMLAILVYKFWESLQGKGARTTSGKAVGFLFIPFFNFYWIFQAYWGWTKDFNQYISSANINTEKMPEGMVLTMCILTVLSIIPFVGILIGIANFILMALFFNKAIDGVNTINAQNA